MQGDYFIHFCTRSARKADRKLLNIAKSYNALILKAIFSRISLNLWNSLSTVHLCFMAGSTFIHAKHTTRA